VFLLRACSGVLVSKCLNEALRFLQLRFLGPGQFSTLQCDNGPEFRNSEVEAVLDKYGLAFEDIASYCHEHNGLIERVNRTLEERGRGLLFEACFPAFLWGFAIRAACYHLQ